MGTFFFLILLLSENFPVRLTFFFELNSLKALLKLNSAHSTCVKLKNIIYKHFLRFREDRVSTAHSCVGMWATRESLHFFRAFLLCINWHSSSIDDHTHVFDCDRFQFPHVSKKEFWGELIVTPVLPPAELWRARLWMRENWKKKIRIKWVWSTSS